MAHGVNSADYDDFEAACEGSPQSDPSPSKSGPAFDPNYDGNARDRASWERDEHGR